ncbi:MAG TPA: hypothetical protein DEP72_04170 [Clostridiales bacterium]|nr:MAG: hypothetical protein A2Y18_08080 [Clostridiales bacterium GWD2_32_19]HCC07338.1 hypothetical protein [Clostridiales bacterium]
MKDDIMTPIDKLEMDINKIKLFKKYVAIMGGALTLLSAGMGILGISGTVGGTGGIIVGCLTLPISLRCGIFSVKNYMDLNKNQKILEESRENFEVINASMESNKHLCREASESDFSAQSGLTTEKDLCEEPKKLAKVICIKKFRDHGVREEPDDYSIGEDTSEEQCTLNEEYSNTITGEEVPELV